MSVVLKKLTVEDLETFPDNGYRYEIIAGDLTMSPAPSKKHQRLLARLFKLFDGATGASPSGEVFFSPVDVRFSKLDQVQPDLIFIRNERAGSYQGSTMHGPPDIVVEVLSPSNRNFDEVAKLRLYEANGVPEYWIVDPEGKSIRRFVLSEGAYEEARPIEPGKMASSVLPNLEVDLAALFRDLDA